MIPVASVNQPGAAAPATVSPLDDPDLQWKPPVREPKQTLDRDAFLQLLVSQMKYQDPSSPMDMNQMMAQTSSMSTVEKLTELAQLSRNSFAIQQRSSAASAIGQNVTWNDKDGISHTGTVDSVTFRTDDTAILNIGDNEVPWEQVAHIGGKATGSAGDTTPGGTLAGNTAPGATDPAGQAPAGATDQAAATPAPAGDAAVGDETVSAATQVGQSAGQDDAAAAQVPSLDRPVSAEAVEHVRQQVAATLAAQRTADDGAAS